MTNPFNTLKELPFTDMVLTEKTAIYRNGGRSVFHDLPEKLRQEADAIFKECKESESKNIGVRYEDVNYRCAIAETTEGLTVAIRKPVLVCPKFSELGYPPAMIQKLLSNEKDLGNIEGGIKHGLVVISGETCSGKTTSASALMVERLTRYGGLGVTIEDPIELPLQGAYGENHHGQCYQFSQVSKMGGMGDAGALSLRFASPNIILYGEIRDANAAKEAIRAALSGHLIITTIHSAGIAETVERLAAYAAEEKSDTAYSLLANGLSVIIHQELVMNEDNSQVQLFAEALYMNEGIRAKIRAKETHTIYSEVTQQKSRLLLQPTKN